MKREYFGMLFLMAFVISIFIADTFLGRKSSKLVKQLYYCMGTFCFLRRPIFHALSKKILVIK